MFSDHPPAVPNSWGVYYAGEPRKGQQYVDVRVWVRRDLVQASDNDARPRPIADYLAEALGWTGGTGTGWGVMGSGLGDPDDLVMGGIGGRCREVPATLAPRGNALEL